MIKTTVYWTMCMPGDELIAMPDVVCAVYATQSPGVHFVAYHELPLPIQANFDVWCDANCVDIDDVPIAVSYIWPSATYVAGVRLTAATRVRAMERAH